MKQLRERLIGFVQAHQVLTIAVVDDNGHPHAAALFYAADDDLNFYAVTDPRSRHGQAMVSVRAVAGTIQRDHQQWQEATGVQFAGTCRKLTGSARAAGWKVFITRFGFLKNVRMTGIGELASALAKVDLWRIEPNWMRLIDNRLGFAHKEEWMRPA